MNYKKMLKSKDFQLMVLCAVSIGLFSNVIVYRTLPEYKFCMVTNQYETINGSCDFVKEELKLRRSDIIGSYKSTPTTLSDTDFKSKVIVKVTNTTTLPKTTTTLQKCPICSTIPDCVCTCPECSKCPTCNFEPTQEQIKWMLNYKPRQGSAGYQAGGFDCKDDWLEYLDVDGRPKFKSAPANKFYEELHNEKDCTVNFVDPDCDGAFYLNNSIWLISGEGSLKWVHKK